MIEFWYEFASTYSYPAAMRVERMAEAAGVRVEWRPFLLGPLFHAQQGLTDSPFNAFPVKGQYMWRDMERVCAEEGLPLNHPSQFPRNSLLAARVAVAGLDEGWTPDFSRKVYEANGELMDHFSGLSDPQLRLLERADGGVPIPSLCNVLKLRRPMVIVDEAHNTKTDKSFTALQRLNPSIILELTATPVAGKNTSLTVYNGLVPISPYTTPMAPNVKPANEDWWWSWLIASLINDQAT